MTLRRISAPVFLVIAAYSVLSAISNFPDGNLSTSPALFPVVVGVVLLILTFIQVVMDWMPSTSPPSAEPGVAGSSGRLSAVVVSFAIYTVFVIRFVPFDIGTAVFLVAVLGIVNRWHYTVRDFLYVGAVSTCLPILFQLVLKLPVPGEQSLIIRLAESMGL